MACCLNILRMKFLWHSTPLTFLWNIMCSFSCSPQKSVKMEISEVFQKAIFHPRSSTCEHLLFHVGKVSNARKEALVNSRITQQCLLLSWANTLVCCLKQMQVTFSGPTCTDKTVELPSVLNLSLKSKQGCSSFQKKCWLVGTCAALEGPPVTWLSSVVLSVWLLC